jgi:hypothetical protein
MTKYLSLPFSDESSESLDNSLNILDALEVFDLEADGDEFDESQL